MVFRVAPLAALAALAVLMASDASPSADATCNATTDAASPPLPLSTYAHASNTLFIDTVVEKRPRDFHAAATPATVDVLGRIHEIGAEEKFFTYASFNGWNNQLLNLLCAIDMARMLNRTLIVPPFSWPKRRGPVRVSVGRLVDSASIARTGVRVLFEDEFGSVEHALKQAGVHIQDIAGEGQPHRKSGMPRWTRDAWLRRGEEARSFGLLRVSCCLFWTWLLPQDIAHELYRTVDYHPALRRAARDAAASLTTPFAAMHVRRGDKAKVDPAYTGVFGERMGADYFARLASDQGFPASATVFVATDELDRGWFAPLRDAGYTLRFVDDLAQPPLLAALTAFPQPVWADVLAILEQIVCIDAPAGFVGSLPSTLSGHIVNVRQAREAVPNEEGATARASRPLFVKLHESCCDARTALDLLRLPGVATLADVPCTPHEGNEWC